MNKLSRVISQKRIFAMMKERYNQGKSDQRKEDEKLLIEWKAYGKNQARKAESFVLEIKEDEKEIKDLKELKAMMIIDFSKARKDYEKEIENLKQQLSQSQQDVIEKIKGIDLPADKGGKLMPDSIDIKKAFDKRSKDYTSNFDRGWIMAIKEVKKYLKQSLKNKKVKGWN